MHVDFNQPFFCARARIEVFTKPSSISGNTVMMSILIKKLYVILVQKYDFNYVLGNIFMVIFCSNECRQAGLCALRLGTNHQASCLTAASTLFRLCSSPTSQSVSLLLITREESAVSIVPSSASKPTAMQWYFSFRWLLFSVPPIIGLFLVMLSRCSISWCLLLFSVSGVISEPIRSEKCCKLSSSPIASMRSPG